MTSWIIFSIIVAIMLGIDLFSSASKSRDFRANLIWSGIWIWVAILFWISLFFWKDSTAAVEFFTAYLIEKSLSIDNLFVFLMIFSGMAITSHQQPKILKWWILTAIVMRVIFIFAGVELLERFHFMLYVFGAILLWAAYRMISEKEEEKKDIWAHPIIRFMKKYLPFVANYTGTSFITRIDKKMVFTPLFLTLVFIEFSDLVFAVDSIPAVLAISKDSFIIITSNIFAILGLRALYFVVVDLISKFIYLKQWVGAILFYVWIKMMIPPEIYKIPTPISLGVIAACLFISGYLSWKQAKKLTLEKEV